MATPTYTELVAMVNSSAFIDRCALAVAKYAQFILNENPATANHQRRYSWAIGAIQNPTGVVSGLKHAIAIDPTFTAQNPLNFATTPDGGAGSVQVAVEATINSTVLVF